MKKTVRFFAFAVAVMGLTVACHNNKPAEEVVDSIVEDTVVVEEVDTTPVEEVAEEVATPAPKKPAKKQEAKPVVKEVKTGKAPFAKPANEDPRASVKVNSDGTASVSTGGLKVESSNPRAKAKDGKTGLSVTVK